VHIVLDGEVVDLRVCLQSADKELRELRAQRREEERVHESRLMEHMQRVGTCVDMYTHGHL